MLDELLGLLNAPRDAVQTALGGRQGILDALGIDENSGWGHKALGFGVDMATDPLTYLGGLGGFGAGAKVGRGLAAAAAERGPQYATKAADLAAMLEKVPSTPGNYLTHEKLVEQIRDLSHAADPRLLSEIPQGGRILGNGSEGVAFLSPEGSVTRVGPVPPGTPGRPVDEGVLQSMRTVDYPSGFPARRMRAEHLPLAEDVGNSDKLAWDHVSPEGMEQDPIATLSRSLNQRGLDFYDVGTANMGMHQGRPVVIDPGAIDVLKNYAGTFQAAQQPARQGPIVSGLLDALGANQAVRRSLGRGASGPSWTLPGAGIGGALGLAPAASLNAWGGQ